MTTDALTLPSQAPANWWEAFPSPLAQADKMTTHELKEMMLDAAKEGGEGTEKRFLVVDVRRTDFEDSFIKGAINLPAHSFHPTLPSLLPILSQYPLVIFHCQSSSGRGPRCAGWYQDLLNERCIQSSRAVVLEGGIKKWRLENGGDESLEIKL
ncbi:BZ3500_MvSof-1268-A1-R1_Chr3-1g05469 [Microbotryum saponariae]|uniref:BZ3500_MvSof-1268-A1-R1_Chr3-1g05469 protein n=1 Tax=Microbotryum saponariae TaxID=289078 RepID=A0A2X0LHK6_9BASI|nr:BZ3500_MvSof-1268-A1-R1_Chr3-1g05469 [Microbotryum saponariae]SDA04660.1 BZ3501_MvSof-1269-A2-R1_Chr3-1g05140 [Microbotryum saponariae]